MIERDYAGTSKAFSNIFISTISTTIILSVASGNGSRSRIILLNCPENLWGYNSVAITNYTRNYLCLFSHQTNCKHVSDCTNVYCVNKTWKSCQHHVILGVFISNIRLWQYPGQTNVIPDTIKATIAKLLLGFAKNIGLEYGSSIISMDQYSNQYSGWQNIDATFKE